MTATALRASPDRYTSELGSTRLFRLDAEDSTMLIATPWPEAAIVNTYPQGSMAMWTIVAPHDERTAADPARRFDISVWHAGPAESTGEAIMEIRRLSGLTWQELGDLFEVSRRSVHHWANGKPVSAGNDRKIRRMLAAIRDFYQGNQLDTRASLLAVDQATGNSMLDLLQAGQFNDAAARISGVLAPEPHRVPLSQAAQDMRRPPVPALLVGAEQDRPDNPAKATPSGPSARQGRRARA